MIISLELKTSDEAAEYSAEAEAALLHGDTSAVEACDEAIEVDQSVPSVWTVRGMITYPSNSAVKDFARAIELGEMGYFPHYYLAHHAMIHNELSDAVDYCDKALERNPSALIEAQLQEWKALSQSHIESNPRILKHYLDMQLSFRPAESRIVENEKLFFEAQKHGKLPTVQEWKHAEIESNGKQIQDFIDQQLPRPEDNNTKQKEARVTKEAPAA